MRMPMQNSIWGKLLFENRELGVLGGFHLDESQKKKIRDYRTLQKPLVNTSSSRTNYQPQWTVEDGKIYLTDISLRGIMTKGTSYEYSDEEVQTMIGKDGEPVELKVRTRNIIQPDDGVSTMKKIFGADRLFAEWIDEPMKLLVKQSKQKPVTVNKGERNEKTLYEVTMDLLVLDFKHGILKGNESKQEIYRTALRNYIEELD